MPRIKEGSTRPGLPNMALPLRPYDLADPMVLEVPVADRYDIWRLCRALKISYISDL